MTQACVSTHAQSPTQSLRSYDVTHAIGTKLHTGSRMRILMRMFNELKVQMQKKNIIRIIYKFIYL